MVHLLWVSRYLAGSKKRFCDAMKNTALDATALSSGNEDVSFTRKTLDINKARGWVVQCIEWHGKHVKLEDRLHTFIAYFMVNRRYTALKFNNRNHCSQMMKVNKGLAG